MGAHRQVRSWGRHRVGTGTTDVRATVVGMEVQHPPTSFPGPLCNCFSVPADTPKLKIEVNPTEVKEGNSVTMTCQVISSNPKLRKAVVSWFKDGHLLQEQEREWDQTATLTLHPVTKDMRGKYQCRVSNVVGQGQSEEVALTVFCEFPGSW